ncbi:hypothetical protein [Crassaminicella profunda]|uniref:hypothetical protein n=1 Tax=Crassaminicella profunda TaxID=1286698 RepID=UPI001CA71667|nr:hypothetical protein [Crassaminicella profunda]QZY56653.1 hypothetical protein K7H06_06960 [Crassaminicella profunda]
MNENKGKFFEGRDFYEWGINFDMDKIKDEFEKEIDTLDFYRNNHSNITKFGAVDLDKLDYKKKKIFNIFIENKISLKDIEWIYNKLVNEEFFLLENAEKINDYMYIEESIITQIIEKYPVFENLKENDCFFIEEIAILAKLYLKQKYIHNKMCLINLYTILDEYIADIIKVIGMYDSRFLDNENISIPYKEVRQFNNDDIKELAINVMLSKTVSGVNEKINKLLNYLDFKEKNSLLFDSIRLFNAERNMLIHNRGVYNKRAIKLIGGGNAKKLKIKEGEKVEVTDKKVEEYLKISKDIMELINDKISKKYGFQRIDLNSVLLDED